MDNFDPGNPPIEHLAAALPPCFAVNLQLAMTTMDDESGTSCTSLARERFRILQQQGGGTGPSAQDSQLERWTTMEEARLEQRQSNRAPFSSRSTGSDKSQPNSGRTNQQLQLQVQLQQLEDCHAAAARKSNAARKWRCSLNCRPVKHS
jgi:hypothetical protein